MSSEISAKLVAIAGATGNCGREVVRAAKEHGLRVRALVRSEAKLGRMRDICDEVRVVQATQRDTLRGALDGADYLVSALGKTFQKDNVERRSVDVDANLYLFHEAKSAAVARVALVSVFMARPNHPVELVRMKVEAEQGLRDSGLPFVIIRPTGFFSDMWELFRMAEQGTVWVIGDGRGRFNPIALEDLGAFIVEALLDDAKLGQALPVGGPEVLSPRDIAGIAGQVLGRRVRVRSVPLWLAKAAVPVIKPFSRNTWELAQFFVGAAEHLAKMGGDAIAPKTGSHLLEDYYRTRYAEEHVRGG